MNDEEMQRGDDTHQLSAAITSFTPNVAPEWSFEVIGPQGAPSSYRMQHERELHLKVEVRGGAQLIYPTGAYLKEVKQSTNSVTHPPCSTIEHWILGCALRDWKGKKCREPKSISQSRE